MAGTVKTGVDHIESLRDGRHIFIDGARVDDVTTHPACRNAVPSAAALHDYQAYVMINPPGRSLQSLQQAVLDGYQLDESLTTTTPRA